MCWKPIGEYDDKIPSDLTAEQILIRSGNIGSVRIAQKIGGEKMKYFLKNIGVLNKIEFDIEEVGEPIPLNGENANLQQHLLAMELQQHFCRSQKVIQLYRMVVLKLNQNL